MSASPTGALDRADLWGVGLSAAAIERERSAVGFQPDSRNEPNTRPALNACNRYSATRVLRYVIYLVEVAHLSRVAHIADTSTAQRDTLAGHTRGPMFVLCRWRRAMRDLVRVDAFGQHPPRRICGACINEDDRRFINRITLLVRELHRDAYEDPED